MLATAECAPDACCGCADRRSAGSRPRSGAQERVAAEVLHQGLEDLFVGEFTRAVVPGAELPAGGIHNEAGGTIELRNSLLAQNNNGGPDCNGTFKSAGFNLVGNVSQCSFTPSTGVRLDNSPRLSPLADNGGLTATHALQFGSPAINRGDPGGCKNHQGSPLNNDQRGLSRIQRCDIGAFEYQTPINEVYLPALMKE